MTELSRELYVDVIIPIAIPHLFTYLVPPELSGDIMPGKRVIVPFGKQKIYSVVIRRISDKPPGGDSLKSIQSVLDDKPIVNDVQFKLWDWISEYYMCHPGEVMNCALPSFLKLQSETRVLLNPSFDLSQYDLTPDENMICESLLDKNELSIGEVMDLVRKKSVHALLKRMLEKGIVVLMEEIEERYRPRQETRLRLGNSFQTDSALQDLFIQLEQDPRKARQLETLMVFLKLLYSDKETGFVRKSALQKEKQFSSSALATMIRNGILTEYKETVDRTKIQQGNTESPFTLSESQSEALDGVKNEFEKHDVVLLHGVTSSGKTEIYIHLIDEMLKAGKQVLYLLPEIALTTQIITRLRKHFGEKVGVYHSRYSSNERVEIWNHVLQYNPEQAKIVPQKSQVILGARSSMFLPYRNLGLIIVDEEHDSSYKQMDPAPRYNARDTAIVLSALHGAKTLLGSATPSLESYYNAEQNKYGLVNLLHRYGGVMMPAIVIADVKDASRKKLMKSHFTPQLMQAVEEALGNKEQVILFQNRRGFSPYLECKNCNWIPHCRNCSVTLTYHKLSHQLRCHYCGYTTNVPSTCQECGDHHLEVQGFGTEKIEEEVSLLFPEARIARMDLDATRTRLSFQRLISDFEERRVDILVGTQMVTKGLDFDNVSTVGILNADQLFNYPDFRSFERSFQLMAQVSGRSGRKQKQGKVIIQTQQPTHWVIRDVVNNDYNAFYKRDLAEREKFLYPPHSRLIEIVIKHKDEQVNMDSANTLAILLRNKLGSRVIGPHIPVVSRIRNLYHRVLLVKIERGISPSEVKKKIRECQAAFYEDRKNSSVQILIDVDPM